MSERVMIDGYPVTRRYVSVEDAEREHTETIDGRAVQFGYANATWQRLIGGKDDEDELWLSESDVDEDGLSGYEAVLLIRAGKVIDSITTKIGVR